MSTIYENVIVSECLIFTKNPLPKGLKYGMLHEAELIVSLRLKTIYPSGLKIRYYITEKDRYQSEGRKISPRELIDIVGSAKKVTRINKTGVSSEKQA